jgi:predicted AAA+ superfamily ATPase
MLLKKDLELAFNLQNEELKNKSKEIIDREKSIEIDFNSNHINIISGIRRCGKSTLLIKNMQENFTNAAYFNFEEPRVYDFQFDDFIKLDEIMSENADAYFFDEIQVIDNWEIFIRRLHEQGKKIFITASNASMLSKELGTKLTGRYLQNELFPFSYKEFLIYKKVDDSKESFFNYMQNGGFPEYLRENNIEILHQLFRDIINRDIIVRHKIKNAFAIEDMAIYLYSNIAKETSFNSLRKILKISSATTVSDFAKWLYDSYLLFFVPRFSYSSKAILMNPKKVYAVDNGLVNALTLSKNEDFGRLLENLAFLYFKRLGFEIYYFRENGECDFVLFKNRKFFNAFQITKEITKDNMDREFSGLIEALQFFKKDTGYILTLNQEDSIQYNGKEIKIISLRRIFMMDKETFYSL